jgi:hypothetical protein
MGQEAYPFVLTKISTNGADDYLKRTFIYQFHSTKSGHQYEVQVESYIDHLYCLKFFDNAVPQTGGRFSQTSGTYEPRIIFNTVASIGADVLQRDNEASFFFVGAADSHDISGSNTRRYRVYRLFLQGIDTRKQFETFSFDHYSLCILVNRTAVDNRKAYVQRILNFIEG